jgi:hypothetical protein
MEINNPFDSIENEGPARVENLDPADREEVSAWELVEKGRYRPRRIRGSFRGRELG